MVAAKSHQCFARLGTYRQRYNNTTSVPLLRYNFPAICKPSILPNSGTYLSHTLHTPSTQRRSPRPYLKMFDENFSFLSSTADPITVASGDCSADISPFTSRCSSPRYPDHSRQSQPSRRRDSYFDTYRSPRHPSVTALTAQLQHHVIDDESYPGSPESMASPSESTPDHDEGFYEGPDTPDTSYSDYVSDVDPNVWDLSMTSMGATSSPRPSLSLEAQANSSYTMRRRQRQALVRLQCLAKRTPDIAMLLEECHPSSLPLYSENMWEGSKSRSNSTISLGPTSGGRISKDKSTGTGTVRKLPRMRKRATR